MQLVRGLGSPGCITVFGRLVYDQQQGGLAPEQIHLSNLRGGILLMAWASVLTAISLLAFRHRDIT